MTQISLKYLCRGPTTTLIFTIVRTDRDSTTSIAYVEHINVNNLVQVSAKFEYTKGEYKPYVKMVKRKPAQQSAVPITVQCTTFKELFFCSAEWIEVQLKPVPPTSVGTTKFRINPNYSQICDIEVKTFCYTIEINFTVQVMISKVILPNKELYEDTESTDFQFRTKDGTVPVHKAVLFLHSNMFQLMFTREWKESTENSINMDGITVKTLQHLKDYMYLGILPDEGLEPLLQVAAHYFMDKLKADCSVKLVEAVAPENIDRLIALACEFNIPELVRGLICRIPDNVLNSICNLEISDKGKKTNNNKSDKHTNAESSASGEQPTI